VSNERKASKIEEASTNASQILPFMYNSLTNEPMNHAYKNRPSPNDKGTLGL